MGPCQYSCQGRWPGPRAHMSACLTNGSRPMAFLTNSSRPMVFLTNSSSQGSKTAERSGHVMQGDIRMPHEPPHQSNVTLCTKRREPGSFLWWVPPGGIIVQISGVGRQPISQVIFEKPQKRQISTVQKTAKSIEYVSAFYGYISQVRIFYTLKTTNIKRFFSLIWVQKLNVWMC